MATRPTSTAPILCETWTRGTRRSPSRRRNGCISSQPIASACGDLPVNRRMFLLAPAALLAPAGTLLGSRAGSAFGRDPAETPSITVALISRVGRARQEIANFGVPFARGQLTDAARVH